MRQLASVHVAILSVANSSFDSGLVSVSHHHSHHHHHHHHHHQSMEHLRIRASRIRHLGHACSVPRCSLSLAIAESLSGHWSHHQSKPSQVNQPLPQAQVCTQTHTHTHTHTHRHTRTHTHKYSKLMHPHICEKSLP